VVELEEKQVQVLLLTLMDNPEDLVEVLQQIMVRLLVMEIRLLQLQNKVKMEELVQQVDSLVVVEVEHQRLVEMEHRELQVEEQAQVVME
jgi:hypothetical protein